MSILLEDASTAIVEVSSNSSVVSGPTSTLVSSGISTHFVVSTDATTLVVELNNTETVTHGQIGPQGPAGIAEEDIVYSKRIDFINDNLLYRGEAQVGSVETSPVWRIRRISIAQDSDITEMWASGTAEFDKQWDLREYYNYS